MTIPSSKRYGRDPVICETCKWCDEEIRDGAPGEGTPHTVLRCRYNPPVVLTVPEGVATIYPVVLGHYWCHHGEEARCIR